MPPLPVHSMFRAWTVAIALAACVPVPTLLGPSSGATSGSSGGAPGVRVGDGNGSLVSHHSGSLVSNHSGSLTGRVTAPDTLLAGAAGDRGVQGNGRIVPAGTRVWLADAAGLALVDAAGAPFETRTDAEGRYRFPGWVPVRNLLVRVDLGPGKGLMQAVAPARGPDERIVDVDLPASLSTAYILERFVRPASDPQTTLDRLSGDLEGLARTRVERALAADGGIPETLEGEAPVRVLERLRSQDRDLDDVFETIRRTLLAAGQSEMGVGMPATRVALYAVHDLIVDRDGQILIPSSEDGRGYTIGADGRLIHRFGTGSPEAGSLEGRRATEAGFGYLASVSHNGLGEPVLLEWTDRLSRIDPEGLVHAYRTPGASIRGVAPGTGHRVVVFTLPDLWMLSDDADPIRIGEVPVGDLPLQDLTLEGRDDRGRLVFSCFDHQIGDPAAWEFDPETGRFARILPPPDTEGAVFDPVSVDPAGRIFFIRGTEVDEARLWVRFPDGTERDLGPSDGTLHAATLGPRGEAYWAGGLLDVVIHRNEGGKTSRIAGYEATGVTGEVLGDASRLSLGFMAGMTHLPDGDLVVSQTNAHYSLPSRLIRVTPGRQASVLATSDERDFGLLRTGGDGRLYVRDNGTSEWNGDTQRIDIVYRVFRLEPDGELTTVLSGEPGAYPLSNVDDFAVARDGTVWYSGHGEIRHVDGQGNPIRVVATGIEGSPIALDGADRVHWLADGNLFRATASGDPERVVACPYALPGGMILDPKGRVLLSLSDSHQVVRITPSTGLEEILAGPGGRFLSGQGVDDGLKDPGQLSLDPAGNLYICDRGHRQVKRLPASDLGP